MTTDDLIPVLLEPEPKRYFLRIDGAGDLVVCNPFGDTVTYLRATAKGGYWCRAFDSSTCAALGIELDDEGRPTPAAQERILRSLRAAGVDA